MTYALITISNPGADVIGPFNIYSDVDGYTSAFESNITLAALLAGFATNNVPVGTTQIRIQNTQNDTFCQNFVPAGVSTLEYYFEPKDGSTYMNDFVGSGNYAYVYGYWSGYYNGSYSVPGNHIVKLNPDRSVHTMYDIVQGPEFHIVFLGATIKELPDFSTVFVGFFITFNGETVNRILKLLPDGTRDPDFTSGLGFDGYTTSVQRDVSGRLYITGIFDNYDGSDIKRGLARLYADGSLDTAYSGGTGFNNATVFSLLNSDNSMYVTGYFNTYKGISCPTGIIKIDEDADVEPTFDAGVGFNVGNNQPIGMARIDGEDSFFCAGYFTTYKGVSEPSIIKLKPNGDKDTDFDAGTGFDVAQVGQVKVIWGDKLFVTGFFGNYNGTPSFGHIILYKDGTVYLPFTTSYTDMYIIGNDIFATNYIDLLNKKIYTHDPLITTTTTTTI